MYAHVSKRIKNCKFRWTEQELAMLKINEQG
jgi:hypothetical protein